MHRSSVRDFAIHAWRELEIAACGEIGAHHAGILSRQAALRVNSTSSTKSSAPSEADVFRRSRTHRSRKRDRCRRVCGCDRRNNAWFLAVVRRGPAKAETRRCFVQCSERDLCADAEAAITAAGESNHS
jgi:hypothetical protein